MVLKCFVRNYAEQCDMMNDNRKRIHRVVFKN